MALIKSISGIRGTIGGKPGESLSPVDIVKFAAAYGTWVRTECGKEKPHIVIGRDARPSGPMVNVLLATTLQNLGISITDLGLATTPTVEIAVTGLKADGGIIITASHNPSEWNALKLLGANGEFLSAAEGSKVLEIAKNEDFVFVKTEETGIIKADDSWTERHIKMILDLREVDVAAIRKAGFSVAVDCVNSVGGIVVPQLLKALGVKKITEINTTADGKFSHNPEPLPENLKEISDVVVKSKADLGIVVDPDVDRLAIICEDGSMFGEEYTLVAVADYILKTSPGATVSNLSSSRALKDVTEKHGCNHYSAAVGEVNVVEEMKIRNAVIGGEGNGGVIYPGLHYGRDALAGIALFLSHLAKSNLKCTELRASYPEYYMAKKKLVVPPSADFNKIVKEVMSRYKDYQADLRDGLWMGHSEGWVQIRKSNTEPILRIYAEGRTLEAAENQANEVISFVKNLK